MVEDLRAIGEKSLLRRLSKYHSRSKSIIRSFSEDCAVVDHGGSNYQLFTVDVLIDGVHFQREYMPAFYIGRKGLKVNISDISAMGGKPLYYMVSLGAPPNTPGRLIEEIYEGMRSVSEEKKMRLIGGNVSSAPSLFLDIFVVGEVSKEHLLLRNGARKGDSVFVSGALGSSSEGLRLLHDGFRLVGEGLMMPERVKDSSYVREAILSHIDPECSNELAQRLARTGLINSMIDLSDGLASDLSELCTESGVGATLEMSRLPVAPSVLYWAKKRKANPWTLAVTGGEDYHLLFTVSRRKRARFMEQAKKEKLTLFEIGRVVDASEGITAIDSDGNRVELRGGFDHFVQ